MKNTDQMNELTLFKGELFKRLETLNERLLLNALDETYFIKALNLASMSFEFDKPLKQFTIYNPTGRAVYISISDVSATNYMFTVATNKYFISPPFLFKSLYILQTSFTASSINPILTAHNKTLLSPGSFVIP